MSSELWQNYGPSWQDCLAKSTKPRGMKLDLNNTMNIKTIHFKEPTYNDWGPASLHHNLTSAFEV